MLFLFPSVNLDIKLSLDKVFAGFFILCPSIQILGEMEKFENFPKIAPFGHVKMLGSSFIIIA